MDDLLPPIDCGSCRKCCYGQDIRITDDERKKLKLHHKRNGFWVLKTKKSDDSCIYLREGGCGVYKDRPIVCREFDCRQTAHFFGPNSPVAADMPEAYAEGKSRLALLSSEELATLPPPMTEDEERMFIEMVSDPEKNC